MVNLDIISIESKSSDILSGEVNQQNKVLTAKDCPRWDSCSANICPLDLIDNAAWYPDEEVCTSRIYTTLPWIRRQRKIGRTALDIDTFYTKTMLERDCVITKQIQGLDPDRDYSCRETDEERWLNKHPEKKAKTKEEIELLKNRMAGIRKGLTTKKNDQSAEEISKKDTNPLRVLEPNSLEQYEGATKEGNMIITRDIN